MFRFAALILSCLLLFPALAPGQPQWDAPLLPGPDVTIGTLENGLTYYIRENARPGNRVLLRLVVNAGSILEEEDQQGVAHFLEHMAFNGTEHFESTDMVDYLESIGASFGADLNAYTTFDETVYMLEIPTDKPELLEQGVLILRDWAGGMTLDPDEIEKERGVVLEEWRRGQGAGARVREVLWPVVLKDSRYAERLPIGTPEVIETVSKQRIEDFYRTWYRPDLMAVIAVGDVDPHRVQQLIEKHFNTLPSGSQPFERPLYPVPHHEETLAATITDKELTSTSAQVLFKHPTRVQGTLRVYRDNTIDGLVAGMLNQRLAEIALQPDAPFLGAGSAASSFARNVDMFVVAVGTRDESLKDGFEAVLLELQRAALHGFTQPELDRVKSEILSAIESAYNERGKTASGAFTAEYTRNFLQGEPAPGIEVEFAMIQELLPTVTMADVQATMNRLIHPGNRVVTARGPEKESLLLPTGEELLALVEAADDQTPSPYVDAVFSSSILPEEPVPGQLVATKTHEALGITEFLFENGASVWLKPTDFKNDQILIRAVGTPGLCLTSPGNYGNAKMALPALSIAGFGDHSGLELEKLLAGKQLSVRTFIDDFSYGLVGASTQKDLETAFKMMYLSLTQPNHDRDSFTVFKNQLANYLENRENMPEVKYRDELLRVNYSDHYMRRPLTKAGLDLLDMERGLEFYEAMFSNVAGLRFFIVGSFEVGTVLPLLKKYIGSLPGDPASAYKTCEDPGIHFPTGTRTTKVFSGREPKATCTMTWKAPASMDEMEMFRMRMATDILEIRLRNILREELGGTYTVGVGYYQSPPYKGYATTSISFGSAPETVDSMVETVFQEIAKFKGTGPTPEELAKVQEMERRNVETGMERNNYWSSSLTTMYLLNWDPNRILERTSRIETLTPQNLMDDFRKYFPENNYTVVTLMPE